MRILSLALVVSAAALPASAQQSAPSASLHLRMLTWPGKVEASAPRQAEPMLRQEEARQEQILPPLVRLEPARPEPARREPPVVLAGGPSVPPPVVREAHADLAWQPAYRPVNHGASHMLGDLTPAQAAAVNAQRAADAAQAEKTAKAAKADKAMAQARAEPRAAPRPAPAAHPALPASIYAPAPERRAAASPPRPAPPSVAQAPTRLAAASPYDQKTHFYSLHRAYGETPDPVTLSPQFLSAASPDLADPPPPPLPRILPGATPTPAQLTATRVQQQNDSSGN